MCMAAVLPISDQSEQRMYCWINWITADAAAALYNPIDCHYTPIQKPPARVIQPTRWGYGCHTIYESDCPYLVNIFHLPAAGRPGSSSIF